MARPDVTVVIPAYNPDTADLQRAVDSAWASTCVQRVIVVDDGNDRVPIVPDAETLRIPHGGFVAACNAGLDVVQTEWAIFLDDDDCFTPGAVDALREAVTTPDQYAYGDMAYVLQGEMWRPGAWHPDINRRAFGTRYAVLRHTSHDARYWRPDDWPLYYADWDYVLQLEAAGCTGVYVPQTIVQRYKRPDGWLSSMTRDQRHKTEKRLGERWGWL